jgi:hypothetical protein
MSQCLHPCPSCAQHLRPSETVCPFCQAALPAGFGACTRDAPRGRPMSRAALLFVGATVAASCGGATESGSSGGDGGKEAATDSGGGDDTDAEPVALYGPAPIHDGGPKLDGSLDAADAAKDAASGDEGTAVMYGPATIDSGNGGG